MNTMNLSQEELNEIAKYKDLLDNEYDLELKYEDENFGNYQYDGNKANKLDQRNKSHSETYNKDYTYKEKDKIRAIIDDHLSNVLTKKQIEWYKLAYHTETHKIVNGKLMVDHKMIAEKMNITKETSMIYKTRIAKAIETNNIQERKLSKKESELLPLIKTGLSNKDIQSILNISQPTLSVRIKRLKQNNLI